MHYMWLFLMKRCQTDLHDRSATQYLHWANASSVHTDFGPLLLGEISFQIAFCVAAVDAKTTKCDLLCSDWQCGMLLLMDVSLR